MGYGSINPWRETNSRAARGVPDNLMIVLGPSICNDATMDFRM